MSEGFTEKNPYYWFPWVPADYRSDIRITLCSLEARGFWFEALNAMWFCEPRGILRFEREELPAVLRYHDERPHLPKTFRCICELCRNGVASVSEDGYLVSRRMVRDSEARGKAPRAGARARPDSHTVLNRTETESELKQEIDYTGASRPTEETEKRREQSVERFAPGTRSSSAEEEENFGPYEPPSTYHEEEVRAICERLVAEYDDKSMRTANWRRMINWLIDQPGGRERVDEAIAEASGKRLTRPAGYLYGAFRNLVAAYGQDPKKVAKGRP